MSGNNNNTNPGPGPYYVENHTEQEVVDTLYRVARRLAYKFRFSYNDPDDMMQQGVLEGLKALPKYNGQHPLENFLYCHIRNRLFNYKRDNYIRPNKPCHKCPIGAWIKSTDTCKEFTDRDECQPFYEWKMRNESKKNIMDTLCYTQVRSEGESGMEYGGRGDFNNNLYIKESVDRIRENLSYDSLANLQRLEHGITIHKNERDVLLTEISGILGVEVNELAEIAFKK